LIKKPASKKILKVKYRILRRNTVDLRR